MDDAEQIKALRREKGWTQERMAEIVGVSRWTIIRWEQGKTMPTRLAQKALDVVAR